MLLMLSSCTFLSNNTFFKKPENIYTDYKRWPSLQPHTQLYETSSLENEQAPKSKQRYLFNN
jgi:hypothetical protein